MKEIVLTIGLPGSGKSTYLRNYLALKPHIILCPDQIREEVTGNIEDQSQNGRVFDIFYDRLEQALKSDDPATQSIGLDATFLRKPYRTPIFDIIKDSGVECRITILQMDIPKNEAMHRMKKRTRQVPEHVLDSMIQKYTPLTDEEKERYNIRNVIKIGQNYTLFQEGFTAFVGDIQSCWPQLKQLLHHLGFYSENGEWYSAGACEEVIFLGDLTDRGPDSVSVLQTIMQMHAKGWARSVRGNHDDKLMRYLKGNPVRAAHGLELTIEHLSVLSDKERAKILDFLQTLPTTIHKTINGKKYVATHAWWQEWMLTKEDKSIKERNMYGVVGSETKGEPSRVLWWEHEEYLCKNHIVIFGHYATKVDLPNAKCIDLGACFGRQLAAFIPGVEEDTWIEVESDWDWNKMPKDGKETNVLTYRELFSHLKIDPKDIIWSIEQDPDLIKRRYTVEDNGETYELTVANAAKGLFAPDTSSYAQQLAKGIVYDKHAGEIVSVTLPKFYNYGEKEIINDTLHDFVKSGKYKFQFVEKLDGTQIARFVYKGKVFFNTRSVIISLNNPDLSMGEDDVYTDFYKLTVDAIHKSGKLQYLDPEYAADRTLIFELLHPLNNTIVPYGGSPKLSLLSYTLKNVEKGHWDHQYTVFEDMTEYDLPAVHTADGTLNDAANLLESIDGNEGISEGFVANVIDDNGKIYFRIKFKTPKFFEAMRLANHCTYDRVIEVCTAHDLNTEAEFVTYLKKDKDAFPEELLERYKLLFAGFAEYLELRNEYSKGIHDLFNNRIKPMQDSGASRKDIALMIKDYAFAGHIFAMLDNRPVDNERLNKDLECDPEITKVKLDSFKDFMATV